MNIPRWLYRFCMVSSFFCMLYFAAYALEAYHQRNVLGVLLMAIYTGFAAQVFFSLPYTTRKPEIITEKVIEYKEVIVEIETNHPPKLTPFQASSSVLKIPFIPDKRGVVYLIQDISASGNCKIGMTFNIQRRLGELGTKMPIETVPIHIVEHNDPRRLESELHMKFRAKRKRGEWFALSQEDIEYIKSL